MRPFATSIAALTLAACGGAGDGARKPTVELPLVAPEGANPIIADFIEICSASLYDGEQFLNALQSKPDWKPKPMDDMSPAEMAIAAELDSRSAERDGSQDILRLDNIEVSFPHLEGRFCALIAFDAMGIDGVDANDLTVLGEIPGFLGSHRTLNAYGETAFIGRWSAIGPDGHPITLRADMRPPGDYVSATLATSRPSNPSDDK